MHDYQRQRLELSRRAFLGQSALGLGAAALASLTPARLASAATAGVLGESAALRPQGEARDLPLHGGRAVAPGNVRPQADAGPDRRPADARVVHARAADRAAAGPEAEVPRARSSSSASTASRARRLPTSCRIRRKLPTRLHPPLDAHRPDQPRPGPHGDEHRHVDLRPAEHGRLDRHTAWAARATTCPASSC